MVFLGHAVIVERSTQPGVTGPVSLAGRTVVLRTEPSVPSVPLSRPWRASIVPFTSVRPDVRSCALRLRGVGAICGQGPLAPSSLVHHHFRDRSAPTGAVKARQAVSSAAPAGRTYLALASLTAPVHGLPSVAGDELRKDGGNRANRVPRADRTEQPQRLGFRI